MKKIIVLMTIAALLTLTLGCTKEKNKTLTLESLPYTVWTGELYTAYNKSTIKINRLIFRSEIITYMINEKDTYSIKYKISEDMRVWNFEPDYKNVGLIYKNTWLAQEIAENYLELKYFAISEDSQDILKLTRVE